MSDDELQAIFTYAWRRQRREAVLLTFACGLLIVMTLTGIVIDAPGRSQLIATIAAAVGVVSYGGGSVVLMVRFGRRYRQRSENPPLLLGSVG